TDAVKSGKVRFITKRYEKIFFHWMRNIRDWNISRQIVWGIPIPARYCDACGRVVVDITDAVKQCAGCNGALRKETDTFDTWFSSGQWPFAALLARNGKSEKRKAPAFADAPAGKQNEKILTTKDFEIFYPTDVMETGWDILFFWVARMIMLGVYATGKPPFRNVYLHGLVRDKDRQKMSKSKGNVIDPLGVAEEYGTDALRMALVVGNAPGNDPVISEEKIRAYKHFANKIWNAARFVVMNLDGFDAGKTPKLGVADRRALLQLKRHAAAVTAHINAFRFHRASELQYRYFWHTFADKIIEAAKPRLQSGNAAERRAAQYMLWTILATNLKLLHPFMPFVTEAVWKLLPHKPKTLLLIEPWPVR
ncbi:MAG: class I tRNA ligase family protein, partial [Parcubacteria group bacterium]|nr:class I tRNA ligase family protein [Parcubacteria group bacterium]